MIMDDLNSSGERFPISNFEGVGTLGSMVAPLTDFCKLCGLKENSRVKLGWFWPRVNFGVWTFGSGDVLFSI